MLQNFYFSVQFLLLLESVHNLRNVFQGLKVRLDIKIGYQISRGVKDAVRTVFVFLQIMHAFVINLVFESVLVYCVGLYVVKVYIVMEFQKEIQESRGNKYIRLTFISLINTFYESVIAFTVFFSTLKFSKLISFHKAFMQISATIRQSKIRSLIRMNL